MERKNTQLSKYYIPDMHGVQCTDYNFDRQTQILSQNQLAKGKKTKDKMTKDKMTKTKKRV